MQDSMVSTRKRRANAGLRLKHLIELEEQASQGIQSMAQVLTEDDENVNLLFQEDENDDEFIDSDIDNANLIGLDEEDDQDEDQNNDEDEEDQADDQEDDQDDESRKRSLADADLDDVLSDSEISASDNDESEGERELARQESVKKRSRLKRSAHVPAIKKITPKDETAKRSKTNLVSSDTLLMADRRSSSRSAAVESKQALVQRLKESEERRASYVPVIKEVHVEMTQQEKLLEAVETERLNVLSLNLFREQEFVKKEHQRVALMSKRKKLVNVIRLNSQESYVSATEEVAHARRSHQLQGKTKKRPGRRKKFQPEPLPQARLVGEIDTELPLVKEEMERARLEQEAEREREEKEKEVESANEKALELATGNKLLQADEKEPKTLNESELVLADKQESQPLNENDPVLVDKKEQKLTEINEKLMSDEKQSAITSENLSRDENDTVTLSTPKLEEPDPNDTVETSKHRSEEPIMNSAEAEGDSQGPTELKDDVDSGEKESSDCISELIRIVSGPPSEIENSSACEADALGADGVESNIAKDDFYPEHEINGATSDASNLDDELVASKPTHELTQNGESMPEQSVLSDAVDSVNPAENEPLSPSDAAEPILIDEHQKNETMIKIEEESDKLEHQEVAPQNSQLKEGTPEGAGEVFEGPAQKIARNMIYLVDFDDSDRNMRLSIASNVKSILFGPQALLPALRRSKDVKTVARIGGSNSPYDNVPVGNDLFEPVSAVSEDDPVFESLRKLPRLGVAQDFVEEVHQDIKDDAVPITIEHEAPTGLYLPNGNKKPCLITGTEVKYFDPANGIPYSSVETYRFLKQIEQGLIPWYSIAADQDDAGVVELYLGSRDGSVRHAQGVPDGFDA